jgi:hypothetical protein
MKTKIFLFIEFKGKFKISKIKRFRIQGQGKKIFFFDNSKKLSN